VTIFGDRLKGMYKKVAGIGREEVADARLAQIDRELRELAPDYDSDIYESIPINLSDSQSRTARNALLSMTQQQSEFNRLYQTMLQNSAQMATPMNLAGMTNSQAAQNNPLGVQTQQRLFDLRSHAYSQLFTNPSRWSYWESDE
jgi:hypothetical protein